MSYDICLRDPNTNDVIQFDKPHFISGGTYAINGTTEAWLNITYNYGEHFRRVINEDEGIRFLYGKTAGESIDILCDAIAKLDNDVSEDYWEATEGNAKASLMNLLRFALARPDGIWDGD